MDIANGAYAIVAIGTIVGGIKSIDWLISTKYKTKNECESCRSAIYQRINSDRDLLVSIDTKMDLVMENFNLKVKE